MLHLTLHYDMYSFIVHDIDYGYIAYLVVPMDLYDIAFYGLNFILLIHVYVT